MKKTMCVLALSAITPLAFANSAWKSQYWDYANSVGDGTPLSPHEWGVRNGFIKEDSLKERIVLSKEDQAEIARQSAYGDGTPRVEVVPGTGPRKKLTPSEVEYIRFMDTYGDGTPPSYHDWKSSKRR